MHTEVEKHLAGRDRSRLENARVNGYLNATCPSHQGITRAHGFWCWRLRVPLVWFERKSPRSKYGRVHLDLFTTANVLTSHGQAELTRVTPRLQFPLQVAITPFEALWDNVPEKRLEELARSVFRIATRLGNYELRQREVAPDNERTAPLDNVLPWRRSA